MPIDDVSKLVIVGAPRSGTNALRNALCALPGYETWDCDEINYIWRYGNLFCEHDALEPDSVTAREMSYIRRKFEQRAKLTSASVIVEKTCANCLRLPFVDKVIPDAKYLAIFRSPADAILSAVKRWTGSFDSGYIFAKFRHMPKAHVPYYITRFGVRRLLQSLSPDNALSSWGPIVPDQAQRFAGLSVVEKCTLQWLECVTTSLQYLRAAPPERVYPLTYNEFVGAPSVSLEEALSHFALSHDSQAILRACNEISASSVGKGQTALTSEEASMVLKVTGPLWDEVREFRSRYLN